MPESTFTLDGPANALAINKDSTSCAVAGRTVFKIFGFDDDDRITEKVNLRVGKNINLNYSCSDVVWNPEMENVLATAATNGAVVIWDLNKISKCKQEFVFTDHKRTVNKVVFHDANTLLSGSQDYTMKCFDIRKKEAVKTYLTPSESVRDIKFCPSEPNTFAAVQDNGNVQFWDWRRSDRCIKQFTAHSGPVFTCDWHPSEMLFATGGRDKSIRVWDTQQSPTLLYTIGTIASVAHIKWRPSRHKQIASTSQVIEHKINIWDIRRPYVPLYTFSEHKDVVTGCAFRNGPEWLLSTSKDSTLILRSFDLATMPAQQLNPVSHRFNCQDKLAIAIWERLKNQSSKKLTNKGSLSTSSSMASMGSSSNLVSLGTNGNALIPSSGITTGLRKSSQTMSSITVSASVPQSISTSSSVERDLEQLHTPCKSDLIVTKVEHNATTYSTSFRKLALTYRLCGMPFQDLCDHNAKAALDAGQGQICQTWRILKTLFPNPFMSTTSSGGTATKAIHIIDPVMQRSFNDEKTSQEGESRHNSITNSYRSRHPSLKDDEIVSQVSTIYAQNDDNERTGDRSGAGASEGEESDGALSDNEEDSNGGAGGRNGGLSGDNSSDVYSEEEEVEEAQEVDVTSAFYLPRSKVLTVISIPEPPSRFEFDTSLIRSMLSQYVDVQGDVQTAVSMMIVLGDRLKNTPSEAIRAAWVHSYLELLSRFELWNIANQIIILCSDINSVGSLNQQSTRNVVFCELCDRELPANAFYCSQCNRLLTKCAICDEVIKGLYVWCQGCSHGGHVSHMKKWFQSNKNCPTGCGHLCEYI